MPKCEEQLVDIDIERSSSSQQSTNCSLVVDLRKNYETLISQVSNKFDKNRGWRKYRPRRSRLVNPVTEEHKGAACSIGRRVCHHPRRTMAAQLPSRREWMRGQAFPLDQAPASHRRRRTLQKGCHRPRKGV